MRLQATLGIALIFGTLLFTVKAWAQSTPSSTSLCDMPSQRGTAMYNKYCGARNSRGAGYDYGAAQRAQDAANAAAAAAAEAEQRRREAELEQQRVEAESKRRMEEIEKQAKFIDDRDAAASTLKGSTGSTLTGGSTEPGLRGSSATTGLRGLRPAPAQAPNLDPMVVDARKVPSGLPKSVENAITKGYADALPGVSDRVRKGFQSVMTHDWKVAKAWFEDALNHDPDNAGLKRLVELADYTGQRIVRSDAGKLPRPAPQRGSVQLPTVSDIQFLFPGWEPAYVRSPTALSGASKDLPKDSDIEFLFPGLRATEARKLTNYIVDQALKMTANDPVLIRVSNWLRNRKRQIP